MGYEQVIQLPDRSIGRSGRDLFLSHKDITLIMVPFERYSVFPKAVDRLYRDLDIPFNLIVVEGNAPEPIRVALEKRQRRHGNMTIIYTNHCPTLPNAFNLALPHFKTPSALLMDNEVRLPKGTIEAMLESARTSEASMVWPKNSVVPRQIETEKGERRVTQTIETFGLRPCFLISQEAVRELGKLFDEFSSLYTLGIDFAFKAQSKGLRVHHAEIAKVEAVCEGPIRSMDLPLFRAQWNRERYFHSLQHVEKKWGIQLTDDLLYTLWTQTKFEQAEKSTGLGPVVAQLLTGARDTGWKRMHDVVTHFRSVGLSKNSYFPKINVSR